MKIRTGRMEFRGPEPGNITGTRNASSFSRYKKMHPSSRISVQNDGKNIQTMTCATSFGFDNKSITDLKNVCPQQLENTSPEKSKKDLAFGQTKRISFTNQPSKIFSRNPILTKYERTVFGKSQSFTYRSKYEDPLQRHKNKLGPGQYNAPDLITKKGFYAESKYRASSCRKVGREKRFGSDETPVPGPGKYKDQLGLDPVGNYFNSRIPSKGIRTFGKPNTPLFFRGSSTSAVSCHFPEFPDYLTTKV